MTSVPELVEEDALATGTAATLVAAVAAFTAFALALALDFPPAMLLALPALAGARDAKGISKSSAHAAVPGPTSSGARDWLLCVNTPADLLAGCAFDGTAMELLLL